MALVPCPECKQQISDRATACPRCGCPVPEPAREPPPPRQPLGPIKYLYGGFLLLGLVIAGYIYLVAFDSFSETRLVQLTPVWFFCLVLGYYGLIAERMLVATEKSHAEVVADGLFKLVTAAAPGPVGKLVSAIVHLPFLLVRSRRSWIVAAGGAVIWAAALWFFFAAIFPSL